MIKIAVIGATGRMGRAIVRLAEADEGLQLVGAATAASDPHVGKDAGDLAGVGPLGVEVGPSISAAIMGADVAIDFTLPSAFNEVAHAVETQGVALVSGTTGLTGEHQQRLAQLSSQVPVLWSANMSAGIQVLAEVVEHAVRRLGLAYDVEITEVHHRNKVDAPSGTAKRLAQAAQAARPQLEELHGRSGDVGARTANEMGVFGLRGGDVVGDHTVYLFGPGERLELTHRATSRDVLALGALRAAKFLSGRAPGLYRIADMLG